MVCDAAYHGVPWTLSTLRPIRPFGPCATARLDPSYVVLMHYKAEVFIAEALRVMPQEVCDLMSDPNSFSP
jgi:hypothetical protein